MIRFCAKSTQDKWFLENLMQPTSLHKPSYLTYDGDLGFDPGFLTNAIDVNAYLYTNATTTVKLDFAMTDLMELGRGTIPGDIPSPILFLTFVEPLLTHSFAIGCMTMVDIDQFDAIRTRQCKQLHRLPVTATTTMVHEDKNKAGLGLPSLSVTYAHERCKSLLHAFNDKGILGPVTWNLLLLLNTIIGVTLQKPASKTYLHRTTHYYVARQLASLKEADLDLQLPHNHKELKGNALSECLSNVTYDPNDQGLECNIPA